MRTQPTKPLHLSKDPQHDPLLRTLYIITTILCVFMVFWILIFPASSFHESSEWRRIKFAEVNPPGALIPPEIVTKYHHQPLAQYTHILPGAIWAALVPLQLHPTFRTTTRYRTVHRYTGYVFLATTLVMSFGVFVILYKKLTFEDFFAARLDGEGSDTSLSSEAVKTKLTLLCGTLYFAGTALVAVRAATQGRIRDHQRAILRHIGSGLWIAIQRFILVGVMGPYYEFVLQPQEAVPPAQQRLNFVSAAYIGMVLSVGAAEVAILRLKKTGQRAKLKL